MPGLRSLRNRLAVIFALIIVGAIGTIYLSVTPRLEASLTSQRLDQVAPAPRSTRPDVAALISPRSYGGQPTTRAQAGRREDQARPRPQRPPLRRERRTPRSS